MGSYDPRDVRSDARLTRIVRAVGSRKHKAYVHDRYPAGSSVMTGWDGGSKDEWYVVRGDHAEFLPLAPDSNRMGDPFGQRKVLPEFPAGADAVVECGVFCGKPAMPRVYFPESAAVRSEAR